MFDPTFVTPYFQDGSLLGKPERKSCTDNRWVSKCFCSDNSYTFGLALYESCQRTMLTYFALLSCPCEVERNKRTINGVGICTDEVASWGLGSHGFCFQTNSYKLASDLFTVV